MFEFIYLLVFKPIHLPPAYGQGQSLLATRDKISFCKICWCMAKKTKEGKCCNCKKIGIFI